jgi:hypothetical protein
VITAGARLGLTDRNRVANRGVYVSTVYLGSFEAYFDSGLNSIPEVAHHIFRFMPAMDIPLTEHDFEKYWRSWYWNADLNEDDDTDDNVSPYELLKAPVYDEDGLPVKDNDLVDGYVMGSTFSESIRRTMLHELFHALSKSGYHPRVGESVMRQGLGPASVDIFLAGDKREIDLRLKRGFWLIDHE